MKFINEWRQFLKEENFIKDLPLELDEDGNVVYKIMKKLLILLNIPLFFSCNSIENIDVNKLNDPCDCLDAKLEIHQQLNTFYDI